MLFIDSDEFLFCSKPNKQTPTSWGRTNRISQQSFYQFSFFDRQSVVEEVKFVRRVYSGRLSLLDAGADLTNLSNRCMLDVYDRSKVNISDAHMSSHADITSDFLAETFSCWSGAALNNNPGKSADLFGRCPFHWNHLSCVHWKDRRAPSWKNRDRFVNSCFSILFSCRCFCDVGVPDEYPSHPLSLNPIRGPHSKDVYGTPILYEFE